MVWVAGKGREASFRALAKKLQLDHQIRFLKKRSDMERLYAASDVMVLPTRYDSFSNVVLEAMACDIPVITTRNNGAAEIIEPGRNGFVLDNYDDASGLAKLIRGVMTHKQDWTGKAREKAEDYSLEKCASNYARLLSSLG
jgi:UDP-glucose:(heptosyl)LPS alpha-1,3-glucosyltransferase